MAEAVAELRYRGWRSKGKCRVVICKGQQIASLTHVVRHSPDGFEWGYAGSGPADLARSILVHFRMHTRGVSRVEACAWADELYQEFKQHIVAVLPRERWTLDLSDVSAWVSEQEGK